MANFCALSLSGGLDSAVLCASLLDEHGTGAVAPVFFRYGSKHNKWEEEAAQAVAAHFGLALTVVDLTPVFAHAKSALLAHDERDIPKACYEAETMAATVVPGRNLIFASVLASFAESRGLAHIALATHAGDHHLYADCRPTFNAALAAVLRESSDGKLALLTPFSGMSKADIVARGLALDLPFALTRSCYETDEAACGRCGTCRERLEAFALNEAKDPIVYAAQQQVFAKKPCWSDSILKKGRAHGGGESFL